MAKKKKKAATPKKPVSDPASPAGTFEQLGKQLDEIPAVRAAEEAVRRARQELADAQKTYHQARRQAADEVRALPEKNVGEWIDVALRFVKKHPVAGVGLAAMLGFFFGRIFRR